MDFNAWLISIGKSPKTAKNYSGAISGGLSTWASDAGLIESSVHELGSVSDFRHVATGIRKLAIYGERNAVGKGMYSAALNAYGDYLADITQSELEEDLDQIINDSLLNSTEKSTLINIRVGQGHFRKKLIELWGGCAVTGYRDSRFLIASHIKPWSKSDNQERLDPFNGLLLLPNLDKVFDLGYISFEASGCIRISGEFEEFETLGINEKLKARLMVEHQGYLEFHRDVVFKQ